MVLWSVDVNQLTMIFPFDLGTTRGARACGSLAEYSNVVTFSSAPFSFRRCHSWNRPGYLTSLDRVRPC